MNAFSQNTNRRLKMINIILIVFGLLISSGTHFSEECPQEVESVEVEQLLLVQRDAQHTENKRNESGSNFDFACCRRLPRLLPYKIATTATSERGKMNGIGTYLLV